MIYNIIHAILDKNILLLRFFNLEFYKYMTPPNTNLLYF
jgi:hypothetical protein